MTAEQRFFARIIYPDKWYGGSRCWEWTGNITKNGYGVFSPGGGEAVTSAHRWSYQSMVGPIPDGLDLDHLCYNRRCCQPLHLEPVLPGENVRRAWVRRKALRAPTIGDLAARANIPVAKGVSLRACRAVLSALAQFTTNTGETRWGVSVPKLAEVSGYSPAAVKRVAAHLIKIGYVEVIRPGGGRAANRWRINVQRLRADTTVAPRTPAAYRSARTSDIADHVTQVPTTGP